MLNKKIVGAAAFAAALAGGGLAGALLGSPSVSGAQESPTTTAPADGSTTAPADGPGFPGRGPRGDFVRPSLEVVASQLGISVDELRSALEGGQTVADLASDKGVDLDGLIAAVVADASTRIDQAVADGHLDQDRADELKSNLTDIVTRFVNGDLRGPGGDHDGPGFGPGGPGFGHGDRGPGLDAAATALGISVDDLRTELEGGKTIAQVAQEKGVDVQTVIDAMVADATQHITDRITNFVNGVSPADDGGN